MVETGSPSSWQRRLLAATAAGALAVSGAVLVASPAAAKPDKAPGGCEKRVNASVDKLLRCVTVDGVQEHLAALQDIADANGGTRASGTPGYTASADYIEATLTASGYDVTRESFEFPFFELSDSSFAQVVPAVEQYELGADYIPMSYTAGGTVSDTAVTPVDPGSGDSGCEAADFANFPAGDVALIQRGACSFALKAANAEDAGASAAIIVNNVDGPLNGSLGGPGIGIPVIGIPTTLGVDLAGSGTTVDLSLDAVSEIRTTENVTAQLPGRTDDDVLVVGAHLDSVPAGPGINDNGSGSAVILEVAQNLANTQLERPVRFAWWGAEELGLLGSTEYVATRTEEQLAEIGTYLNFDMVGSPNFARFVYDSDGSTFDAPEGYVTEESAAIEATFEEFYDSRGLAYEDTAFDGRSDYQAFADAGIPSGGLFTGAEGAKTPEQAARYGGTAGEAYDSCYHQACDTLGNISLEVLDQNADAIAYATLVLADEGTGPGQGNGAGPGHGQRSAPADTELEPAA